MIVADTGVMVALIDASEHRHRLVRRLYEQHADEWILPAAILPEVDYLLATHLSAKARSAFLADLADGAYLVDWGQDEDLVAAQKICARYQDLRLGFVDAMVIAAVERLEASAIATLDLRHFAAVAIRGNPRLLPRDAST